MYKIFTDRRQNKNLMTKETVLAKNLDTIQAFPLMSKKCGLEFEVDKENLILLISKMSNPRIETIFDGTVSRYIVKIAAFEFEQLKHTPFLSLSISRL